MDKNGKSERNLTNGEGFVKFADLDVGMYLVIETTTPDSVVKPVDPFLDFHSYDARTDRMNGQCKGQLKEWLYDVVVYPKNSSAQRRSITLVKKGKAGGKDAMKSRRLDDVIFKLQR